MAPEQLAGGEADARSDMFAFCVSLHEGLYGQRPFEGATLDELGRAVRGPLPPPPSGTRVPPWIRRVLQRGLSTDPDARYPSMKALLDALSRDPASTRRRVWAGALGVVLLGVAAVSGWSARARAPLCEGGEQKLAGLWDEARKDSIQRAFAATALPYADDAWKGTARALDAWTKDWAAMHKDACLATRRRGEQSEDLLGKRMACLERRLDGARATVDLLSHADAKVVENAARMTESLPRLAECADSAALLAPIAPPPSEALGRVTAARQKLDEAEALDGAGRYEDALRVAEAVLGDAKAIEYAPLRAEAELRVGILEAEVGRSRLADEALLEATLAAEIAHDDALAVRAWIWQVRALADGMQLDPAHRAARHGAALLARIGGGAEREADLESNLSTLAKQEGRFAEAVSHAQRNLELRERLGAGGVALAMAHSLLGSVALETGEGERAEAETREAIRIYTETLGPTHPEVIIARRDLALALQYGGKNDEALAMLRTLLQPCQEANVRASRACIGVELTLGGVLSETGRAAEALSLILHALATSEAESGVDNAYALTIRRRLSSIYIKLGRLDEAGVEAERVLRIDEAHLGPDHPETVTARSHLAAVRDEQGRNAEAIPLLQGVLEAKTRTFGPDSPMLGPVLANLAGAYLDVGRAADALPLFERALAVWEKASATSPRNAFALTGMGQALVALGTADRAVAPLERALSLRQEKAELYLRAETELALADALWKSGGDHRRARKLAEAAKADDEQAGAAGKEDLVKARAWLAAHR
jgi:tetratricopeptide (TPR) repeat protein